MTPRPHQTEGAEWALQTLREYGLAYLSWEERTGKTLTALEAVERSNMMKCLIVTKKRAIDGWMETLEQWPHKTQFVVVNYESVHKLKNTDFDIAILDEAHHAISSIGLPSKTWKKLFKYVKDLPILYLSATPYAEHVGLLFNQFKLSTWSPWNKYKSFNAWYAFYGIPNMIRTPYGLVDQKNMYHTEMVLKDCDHLFNFKTRADVGIEHEPTTNVIVVPLSSQTVKYIETWETTQVLVFGEYELLGDSDMKQRMVHYQLEGGTLKLDDETSIFLESKEKVDYIKENYDCSKVAIMAHFVKERELLSKEIPEALILSSDGHAEGVDLHKTDKLIVYSMSFKTSKHTQRLARQANHNRDTPIEVDIIVGENPAIGQNVYDSVAVKKENFVKSSYERAIR